MTSSINESGGEKNHLKFVQTYWDGVGSKHSLGAAGGVWDRGKPVDIFADLANEYAERLDLKPTDEVLEVGAGSGALTLAMRPKVRRIVATDLSAGMLEHLKSHDIETHHCDAAKLPFADNTFDKTYFHGVSQYFPSLEYAATAVSEMLRVTRPGGRILCGDNMNGRIIDDYYRAEPRSIAWMQKPKYYAVSVLGPIVFKKRHGNGVRIRYLGLRPEFFADAIVGTGHRFYPLLEMVRGKPEHFLRYRYDALIILADADGQPGRI